MRGGFVFGVCGVTRSRVASPPPQRGSSMKVNIGYAYGQLVRARDKGDAKGVAKWEQVIAGMQAGTIAVGSRTPTKAPAWVTLEVVTGGFATGAYGAGGPLTEHEIALAQ